MALEFNADKEILKSNSLKIKNNTSLNLRLGGGADEKSALFSNLSDDVDKLVRVGINTLSPQYELDVEGQIRTTTSIISDTARINNLDIDTIVNPRLNLKAPNLQSFVDPETGVTFFPTSETPAFDDDTDKVATTNFVYNIATNDVGGRIYVSEQIGNDDFDGRSATKPVRSIKKAAQIAGTTPDKETLIVAGGDYLEDNPISIPDKCSVVGDNIRLCIIRPRNPNKHMFKNQNENYMIGVTFRDKIQTNSEGFEEPVGTWAYAYVFDDKQRVYYDKTLGGQFGRDLPIGYQIFGEGIFRIQFNRGNINDPEFEVGDEIAGVATGSRAIITEKSFGLPESDIVAERTSQDLGFIVVNEVRGALEQGDTYKYTPVPVAGAVRWKQETAYTLGQVVFTDTVQYEVTTAGTSGTVAPSHVSGVATNGSASFTFTTSIPQYEFVATKVFSLRAEGESVEHVTNHPAYLLEECYFDDSYPDGMVFVTNNYHNFEVGQWVEFDQLPSTGTGADLNRFNGRQYVTHRIEQTDGFSKRFVVFKDTPATGVGTPANPFTLTTFAASATSSDNYVRFSLLNSPFKFEESAKQGHRFLDGADLIRRNKEFIADEALIRTKAKYPSLIIPDESQCKTDIKHILNAVQYDLAHGGNAASLEAANNYIVGGALTHIASQLTETRFAFEQARELSVLSIRNRIRYLDGASISPNSAAVGSINSAKWVNTQFIAVGDSGNILTSTDGSSWTSRTNPIAGADYKDIIWNGTTTVVVGGNSGNGVVITSTNGINWAIAENSLGSAVIETIAWDDNEQWVGFGGTQWFTSDDGQDWTARGSFVPINGSGTHSVVDVIWDYKNTQFVAVSSGGSAYTSPDGTTWTERTTTASSFSAITGNEDVLIAAAGDVIYKSTDGITWEIGIANSLVGDRYADAADLILANKVMIAEIAVNKMLANNPTFSIPTGNQACKDDVIDFIEAMVIDLQYGGNDQTYDAANLYVTGAHVAGEENESVEVFNYAEVLVIQAMRNEAFNETDVQNYASGLLQSFDNTITTDPNPLGGNTPHTFVSAVTDAVRESETRYTPTTGTTYDPSTGLMVLEIGSHNLTTGQTIRLEPNSLTFSCGFGGATGAAAEKTYPRSNGNDPFYNASIAIQSATATTITLQVLATVPSTNTDPHTFVSATAGAVITDEYTFSNQVTDVTYTPTSGEMVIEINGHGLTAPSQHTASTATYNPNTGFMVVTVANHGFANGDQVKFADNSITFSCGFGGATGAAAEKSYPRPGDYASGRWLAVSNVTQDTFTVQVLASAPSTNVDPHTFVSAVTNGIEKAESTIYIENNGLTFTCGMDNNATNHSYPRPTDPASQSTAELNNGILAVSSVTTNTFTVNVGPAGDETFKCTNVKSAITILFDILTNAIGAGGGDHTWVGGTVSDAVQSGGGYTHTFVSGTVTSNSGALPNPITDIVYTPNDGNMVITSSNHGLTTSNTISIADNALSFTCDMDGNTATKTYPRSTDPVSGQTIAITASDTNTFTINVGASPIVNHDVSNATYNPTTGLLELTIGSHSLSANTSVKIKNGSLIFTCDLDGNTSQKAYPRPSDPYYDTAINIDSVTPTTITLNVGVAFAAGTLSGVTRTPSGKNNNKLYHDGYQFWCTTDDGLVSSYDGRAWNVIANTPGINFTTIATSYDEVVAFATATSKFYRSDNLVPAGTSSETTFRDTTISNTYEANRDYVCSNVQSAIYTYFEIIDTVISGGTAPAVTLPEKTFVDNGSKFITFARNFLDLPVIEVSPYIFNSSVISFLGGSGCEIDGAKVATPNIIRPGLPEQGKSMVAAAFTIISFGGTGYRVINDGYTQLVSVFCIFTRDGSLVESGGYASLTNSASNFGLFALRATGFREEPYSFDVGKVDNITFDLIGTPSFEITDINQEPREHYIIKIDGIKSVLRTGNNNPEYFIDSVLQVGQTTATVQADANMYLIGNANRYTDAAVLIERNKKYIAEEAFYTELYSNTHSFSPNYTKCIRDTELIVQAIADDIRDDGNAFTWDAGKLYVESNAIAHISGYTAATKAVFDEATILCKKAINNQLRKIGTSLTTAETSAGYYVAQYTTVVPYVDTTVTHDVSSPAGQTGTASDLYSNSDCANVQTAINTLNTLIDEIIDNPTVTTPLPSGAARNDGQFLLDNSTRYKLLDHVINLHRPSICNSSSHTWEFSGSGIDYNALPQNGGKRGSEDTADFEQVSQINGRVYASGTDELGNFKVGYFANIENRTGNITFGGTVEIEEVAFLKIKGGDIEIVGFSGDDKLGDISLGSTEQQSERILATQASIRGYITNNYGRFKNQPYGTTPSPGNLVQLDSTGRINIDQIPALRPFNVFTVPDLAGRLALEGPLAGDIVIQLAPNNISYILNNDSYSQIIEFTPNPDFQFTTNTVISGTPSTAQGTLTSYIQGEVSPIVTIVSGGSGYTSAPTITIGVQYANSTGYSSGAQVAANGNLYNVTTSGTTASGGSGPNHTSGSANDGTVTFEYVGVAAAGTVSIDNNRISEITITTRGSGYESVPSVTFDNTGTNGTSASASVNIRSRLAVTLIGNIKFAAGDGIDDESSIPPPTETITKNVTVQNNLSGNNKFYIDAVEAPVLELIEGNTYEFDQSNNSNLTHPLRFSTTANGTWGGGTEYTTGVTITGTPGVDGKTTIVVGASTPTLYYYCSGHSGMGGTANTPVATNIPRTVNVTNVVNTSGSLEANWVQLTSTNIDAASITTGVINPSRLANISANFPANANTFLRGDSTFAPAVSSLKPLSSETPLLFGSSNSRLSYIDAIEITNGGSGYTPGTYNGQTVTGGQGNGLIANFTVSDGAVKSISVTNGGNGYRLVIDENVTPVQFAEEPPRVIFKDANGNVIVNVVGKAITSQGVVTEVRILDGGSGFSTAPQIEFQGVGNSAAATATIDDGVISRVAVVEGGIGYNADFDITTLPAPVNGTGSGHDIEAKQASVSKFFNDITLDVKRGDNLTIAGDDFSNVGVWRFYKSQWDFGLDGALTLKTGGGSGLDADKLDGEEGSYYRDADNINTGRLNENRLSGVYTIDITGVATQSLNLNLSDLRQTTQAPSNAPLGTRGQWKKNADNSLFDGGSDHTVYGSRRGTADGTTFDGYAVTEIALTDNNNQWIRGHGGNFVGSIAITKAGNGYTPGTYKSVKLGGGEGYGLKADITVNASGQISNVAIVDTGYGYNETGNAPAIFTCVLPENVFGLKNGRQYDSGYVRWTSGQTYGINTKVYVPETIGFGRLYNVTVSGTSGTTDPTHTSGAAQATSGTAVFDFVGSLGAELTANLAEINDNLWSSWYKVWTSGNQGLGSGMDSEFLGTKSGTFYRSAVNVNNGYFSNRRLPQSLSPKSVTDSLSVTRFDPQVQINNGSVYEFILDNILLTNDDLQVLDTGGSSANQNGDTFYTLNLYTDNNVNQGTINVLNVTPQYEADNVWELGYSNVTAIDFDPETDYTVGQLIYVIIAGTLGETVYLYEVTVAGKSGTTSLNHTSGAVYNGTAEFRFVSEGIPPSREVQYNNNIYVTVDFIRTPTNYANNLVLGVGTLVIANQYLYTVTTAGTTSASGNGPSHTAGAATDGSVGFTYVSSRPNIIPIHGPNDGTVSGVRWDRASQLSHTKVQAELISGVLNNTVTKFGTAVNPATYYSIADFGLTSSTLYSINKHKLFADGTGNPVIALGNEGESTSGQIRFFTSGNEFTLANGDPNPNGYDVRILASGGTSTVGTGTINFQANAAQVNGNNIWHAGNITFANGVDSVNAAYDATANGQGVIRDSSGDIGFRNAYGDLIGLASENLPLSGGTLTGQLKQEVTNTTAWNPQLNTSNTYTPFPHELAILNSEAGNASTFASLYLQAGRASDGQRYSSARVTAVKAGDYRADLVFGVRDTDFYERVRIRYNGNVGIGVTAANIGSKLTVNATGGGGYGTSTSDSGILFKNFDTDAGYPSFLTLDNAFNRDIGIGLGREGINRWNIWNDANISPNDVLRITNSSGDNVFSMYQRSDANDVTTSRVGMFTGLNVPTHTLTINGTFSAKSKSFLIDHPTKENYKLQHGSLEGPEHGVYVRGRVKDGVITLPDYWLQLVDEDTITVQLTGIGPGERCVIHIGDNKIVTGGGDAFYFVQAERKDVPKMEVEMEVES